jgi:MFS family permease
MNIATNANRWTITVAAAVVMLTIGTIYSWGIFTQPLLVAFGWDLTVTTWAYAIANFCLAAIGAVIGGFWQDKVGPRTVAMTGVTLLGNVLAGLGTASWGAPWLYVTYGVLGGVGAGMAYITPLAMVTKWFPDRKGLAGGLVAGAFGLGAFVYNQVVPRLRGFHTAAVHAGGFITARAAAAAAGTNFDPSTLSRPQIFSAEDIGAVMHVFVGSGVVFLIVGLAAASLFRNPAPGHGVIRPQHEAAPRVSEGYAPSQVLAMPQFYLLWVQLLVNVIAGITIISNAVFILADLTKVSAVVIAPLFGLVSIFNALGRCLWGALLQCPVFRHEIHGAELRPDFIGMGFRWIDRPADRRTRQGFERLVRGDFAAHRRGALSLCDLALYHQEPGSKTPRGHTAGAANVSPLHLVAAYQQPL